MKHTHKKKENKNQSTGLITSLGDVEWWYGMRLPLLDLLYIYMLTDSCTLQSFTISSHI